MTPDDPHPAEPLPEGHAVSTAPVADPPSRNGPDPGAAVDEPAVAVATAEPPESWGARYVGDEPAAPTSPPDVDEQGEPVDPNWDDIETPLPVARADRDDLPPLAPGYAASRERFVQWVLRIIDQPLSAWITLLVVAGSAVYIFVTLRPDLLVQNSTPTGGDMGAHVWGPMYLLKHVLPHGRVSGWTPDWYAGFPAFGYYMVAPALAIIAVHVGLPWWAALLGVLGCLVAAVSGFVVRGLFRVRKVLLVAGLLGVVLCIPVPYNVAFKFVTVLGLVSLPVSAWAFAKLADLKFPAPPLFALAALLYVYNREPLVYYPGTHNLIGTGNIIGGNMASTMAGEYSFSIALSLSLVYFGVLARGLRTGRHRALAAGLLALVGLCHLLPFFFALLATALVFVVKPSLGRLRWLAATLLTGGALASFWMFPFYWRRTYTIDMGFEQLPEPGLHLRNYLAPHAFTWIFLCAGVGLVVSLAYRNRVGVWLFLCCVATTIAVVFMPQIQLWNARVLPFYYLALFLLAAYGVSGVLFALSTLAARREPRPAQWLSGSLTVLVGLGAFVFVGLPLRGYLPFEHVDKTGAVHFLGFSTRDSNAGPDWARWNYSGYQNKPAWPEYNAIVNTMKSLGEDPAHGCGRAMWETDNDREGSYGTPMALMLLPYWTDSCIGSMEGLYFESSATTPYHFLNASELADKPSNPERDLPYPGFDLQKGVQHLRMLGVKYYLADSSRAVQAADADTADLQKVAVSGPWHVYQVRDSELVQPLTHQPVVWNVQDQYKSWINPTADWYLDPSRWAVPFASTGPKSWQRVKVDPSLWSKQWSAVTQTVTAVTGGATVDPLPKVNSPTLPKVTVTNIKPGTDHLDFDVDKVGVPVLVKISYYPNWHVAGAKGPYRVTPNLMVVIPTSKHVRLKYGWTPVDDTGWALTLAGVASLIVLSQLPPVRVAGGWSQLLGPSGGIADGPVPQQPVPGGGTGPEPPGLPPLPPPVPPLDTDGPDGRPDGGEPPPTVGPGEVDSPN
jgi:hypothetical protein